MELPERPLWRPIVSLAVIPPLMEVRGNVSERKGPGLAPDLQDGWTQHDLSQEGEETS